MSEIGIVSRLSTFTGITFTVDTGVDDVALILTGTPDLSVNGAIMNFPEGDNIIIEGFELAFPFQFGQGAMDSGGAGNPMFFQLGWKDNGGHSGSVDEVGDTGRINVPDPNYWFDTFAFVNQPATIDSKWHLEIVGLGGRVSMFNVPDDLNEDVLNACIHMKVRSTSTLIA